MLEDRYHALENLINRYKLYINKARREDISEETIRTWINEFLGIFQWDVQNTNQVLQEKTLKDEQKEKLEEISSEHSKPDYTLVNGSNIKTFLDAKKLSVNIFNDKEAAFQIRSYGWSANVPCAFLTNFEQFSIFDCQYTPDRKQNANVGVIQLNIDNYLTEFKTLDDHLYRYYVYGNQLERLYDKKEIEGKLTVDSYFNKILSDFRIILANEIFSLNKTTMADSEMLNYYVQVILDRIVFIRVCESRGIEKTGLLRDYKEKGFWNVFKNSCYMQFYEHYDGAMFEKDEVFQNLNISDGIFNDFIDQLYYPFPYKFDVIPVKIIAKVYEEFLSYALVIKNNSVTVELKEDYVKTNGAVATREFVVDAICNETFDLKKIKTVEELMNTKILDPCCGSGVFLVVAYEKIAKRLLELINLDKGNRYADLFVNINGTDYLTVYAKQQIMRNCLYGIDYDQVAVEVTKMSLALKIIDDTKISVLSDVGIFGEQILKDIHKNIVCGNTLVSTDIELETFEISYIKPIDIQGNIFKTVFKENGGFDYIVGNPPYVETKYFKAASSKMHLYMKSVFKTFEGKVDLAVLFVERCVNLLNNTGKAGFIIQRRWFKTTYGKGARKFLSDGKYLEKLYDIKTNDLFKGRITYVSVMVLNKDVKTNATYYYILGNSLDVKNYFESDHIGKEIPVNYFSQEIWSPEFYEIESIKNKYSDKWGTLGQNRNIHIRDGIQALWKKIYHITGYVENDGYIIGKNGFGETTKLEKDMVKPVIYNRTFSPLKKLIPDAFCIFPYTGVTKRVKLSIDEIHKTYPLAYEYLMKNKERIQGYVECNDGQYWHTYTREHNHEWFDSPKIIIPMTAKDTLATFENTQGLYMDNANVWFINVDNSTEIVMKALTLIVNSTLFSVFAKSGANPQSGGYYKFNKQFLAPVPLPSEKLSDDNEETKMLANIYDEILILQGEYNSARQQQKLYYEGILETKWNKVDEICSALYEICKDDLIKIYEVGRVINRVTGESGEE